MAIPDKSNMMVDQKPPDKDSKPEENSDLKQNEKSVNHKNNSSTPEQLKIESKRDESLKDTKSPEELLKEVSEAEIFEESGLNDSKADNLANTTINSKKLQKKHKHSKKSHFSLKFDSSSEKKDRKPKKKLSESNDQPSKDIVSTKKSENIADITMEDFGDTDRENLDQLKEDGIKAENQDQKNGENTSPIIMKRKRMSTKISKVFTRSKNKKHHPCLLNNGIIVEKAEKLENPDINILLDTPVASTTKTKEKLHRVASNKCDENQLPFLSVNDFESNETPVETLGKNHELKPKTKMSLKTTGHKGKKKQQLILDNDNSGQDTLKIKKKKKPTINDESIKQYIKENYLNEIDKSEESTQTKELCSVLKFDTRSQWFQMVRFYDYQGMQSLLNVNPEIVNEVNSENSRKTALHLAMSDFCPMPMSVKNNFVIELSLDREHEENEILVLITFLIKNHANLNVVDHFGSTPLHYAVKYNYSRIIKLLLESGADYNIKNKINQLPMDLCRGRNAYTVFSDFVRQKSKKDNLTKVIDTVSNNVDAALEQDLIDLVRKMKIAGKSRKTILTLFGETFLPNIAAENSLFELMNFLIKELDYNVNMSDDTYTTPLHIAIKDYNVQMMKFLLEKGANPMLTNYYGESVISLLPPEQIKDIKKFIKKTYKNDLMTMLFKSNKNEISIDGHVFLDYLKQSGAIPYND